MLDRAGTMPGRGAYLCRDKQTGEPARDCLALAVRRGGFARTLHRSVSLPDELLESTTRVAQPAAGGLAEPLDLSSS